MHVLSLACHLPHNTPNIPSRYNNEQTTKQTKAINNSYIYIYISHVNVTQTVPDISPLMPMHQDPLLVDHSGDYCASIRRPRQPFSHLGNGSASILPPLRDLLRHYSRCGRSMKAQRSCCSSYTETELSGFGRPLSVLAIFLVAQR